MLDCTIKCEASEIQLLFTALTFHICLIAWNVVVLLRHFLIAKACTVQVRMFA